MNTQPTTDSALRGLLTRFNDYADLNELTDNAEAFARALIAECCPDLVIVPRGDVSKFEVLDRHGMPAAGCSGARAESLAEAMKYMVQYADDGPVTVVECFQVEVAKLTRTKFAAAQPTAQEK